MSNWMKLLLGIAAVGTAIAVGMWLAYEWAKHKVQEWLAANGLQMTWLQRAIVQYEAAVGQITATVFVNGRTLSPDSYAPVAQESYDSYEKVPDEGVRTLLLANHTIVQKDVTPMFS